MSNLTETYVDKNYFPISKVVEGMPIIIGPSHNTIPEGEDEIIGRKGFVLYLFKCHDCSDRRCGNYYIKVRIINTDIISSTCSRLLYTRDNKLIVPDITRREHE